MEINGPQLAKLEGELSPITETDTTVFLCCHRTKVKDQIWPALFLMDHHRLSSPVHCHVLDMDANTLAQLNLLARGLPCLALSVTWEKIPDYYKEGALSLCHEFGLIGLHEVRVQVRNRYVFARPEVLYQNPFDAVF